MNCKMGMCLFLCCTLVYGGRGSVSGIATCYGLQGTGFELRWDLDFLDQIPPAPEFTQPPI